MSDWQHVETVPKMRVVLLFAVTDRAEDGTIRNWKMATGCRLNGFQGEPDIWEWDGRKLSPWDTEPTHWRPLPSPPTVQQ